MSGEVIGMSSKTTMDKQEKIWQAESDARTLADAEVIKKDPERLAAAVKQAKKMADEKKKEAQGMAHVAGMRKPMEEA